MTGGQVVDTHCIYIIKQIRTSTVIYTAGMYTLGKTFSCASTVLIQFELFHTFQEADMMESITYCYFYISKTLPFGQPNWCCDYKEALLFSLILLFIAVSLKISQNDVPNPYSKK